MNQTKRLQTLIQHFGRFVNGWKNGQGKPVNQDVVERISSLILIADQEAIQANIFPGLDGSACICFYLTSPQKQDHEIQVGISAPTQESEAKYTVFVERGETPLVSGLNFTEGDARDMIYGWIDYIRSGRAYKPQEIKFF